MHRVSCGLALILGFAWVTCFALVETVVAKDRDGAATVGERNKTPQQPPVAQNKRPDDSADKPTRPPVREGDQAKDPVSAPPGTKPGGPDALKKAEPGKTSSAASAGKLSPEENAAFTLQRFDKNRNGRLDGPERAAARTALGGNGSGRSGGGAASDAGINFYNGTLTGPGQERGDPKLAPCADAGTIRRRRGTLRPRREAPLSEVRTEPRKKAGDEDLPEGGRIIDKEKEIDDANDLPRRGPGKADAPKSDIRKPAKPAAPKPDPLSGDAR